MTTKQIEVTAKHFRFPFHCWFKSHYWLLSSMQKQLLYTDLCWTHFGCTVSSSTSCGFYVYVLTKTKNKIKKKASYKCSMRQHWQTDRSGKGKRLTNWGSHETLCEEKKRKDRKRKWHIRSAPLICSSGAGRASIWWTLGPTGSRTQEVTHWKNFLKSERAN